MIFFSRIWHPPGYVGEIPAPHTPYWWILGLLENGGGFVMLVDPITCNGLSIEGRCESTVGSNAQRNESLKVGSAHPP